MDRCEILGFSPDPEVFHMDFERPVINTFRGFHISITGCFYHLTQTMWPKIQNLGLQDLYKEDEEFKHFCGMIDALAFLPVEEVAEGMKYLQGKCYTLVDDLLSYFDHTYVTGSFRRIQKPVVGEDSTDLFKEDASTVPCGNVESSQDYTWWSSAPPPP